MYRDRFSEFGVYNRENVEEAGPLICQKGIISWRGQVFGRGGIRSAQGSILGEYGICSPQGDVYALGNVISWKGDVVSGGGVKSLEGEIYAGKVLARGEVSADKITADEVQGAYISCGSLRSKGMLPTRIEVFKRKDGKPEASCYVGSWIERLFMGLSVYGLAPASPSPKTSPVS